MKLYFFGVQFEDKANDVLRSLIVYRCCIDSSENLFVQYYFSNINVI